jgi:phosphonate transport system substrate-binding protein
VPSSAPAVGVASVRKAGTSQKPPLLKGYARKAPAPVRLQPRALRAAWVDPHSVAGHLLPKAHLRAKRHVVEHFFVGEVFYGSYGAALQAVIDGHADVAGVHVIPGDAKSLAVALEAHLAGASANLAAIEVTAEVPGDGIAARGDLDAASVLAALGALPAALVDDLFKAERFEKGTPGAYRALYAIAPPEF